MDLFTFEVFGRPIGNPRTRGVHRMNPPDYTVYKKCVRDAAEQAWQMQHGSDPFPIGQAFLVCVGMILQDRSHDGDRIYNTVLDALTGFCWPDDSLRYVVGGYWEFLPAEAQRQELLYISVAPGHPSLSVGLASGSRRVSSDSSGRARGSTPRTKPVEG